ncbi:MAG: ABC transporter permease [Phycisphaerae bacterium]|jgi:phospholipid/cholesterol/gamma-HCH transport system permease protein|nr:ABC transporter permease [Phycisphaerae bacterium]
MATSKNITNVLYAQIIKTLGAFGDFSLFSAQTFRWMTTSLFRPHDLRLLIPQLYEIGAKSVSIVSITGLFVGMVLAVQAATQFLNIGMGHYLGVVINLSVVRELGPVLAGVMLAGRVGGALTAELGTMHVTEQIDALRAMGVDPIRYLVVPRFVACILLTPMLTIFADFLGVMGGYLISVYIYGVPSVQYWRFSAQSLEMYDIMSGLFKSVFFGGAIAMISCYKGFNSQPGAEGVGRACTEAFVVSFVSILTIDFFMAVFLKSFYEVMWGFQSIL